MSTFTWLRSPAGAPTAQNILLHIERLQHIRNLELRSELGRLIQNRLLQLAREGAATTSQHLARFDDRRRGYAALVAVLFEASSKLIDEILDQRPPQTRQSGSIFR